LSFRTTFAGGGRGFGGRWKNGSRECKVALEDPRDCGGWSGILQTLEESGKDLMGLKIFVFPGLGSSSQLRQNLQMSSIFTICTETILIFELFHGYAKGCQ